MTKLNLNKEEQALFADILEYDLKDVRNEISNTENWEFKADLKKKEELIRKILATLDKDSADLKTDVIL